MNDHAAHLFNPAFPRSNAYDPAWVLENQMGPNVLWLTEWLTAEMELRPGMRVLDLGCGKALSSIFLAKEYGVRIWAADLWIGPDANWRRVVEAGCADSVYPLRAEAHALPFPQAFFDAVVSVDAYQYFGTDHLYLQQLSRLVRPGGRLGVVVPGLTRELDTVPAHLTAPQSNGKVFWEDECWSFHTPRQWRTMWERAGCVRDVSVDTLPEGWKHWRDFERALEATGTNIFPSDAEALDADQGRTICFVRALATRSGTEAMNLYDPQLGRSVGVDT